MKIFLSYSWQNKNEAEIINNYLSAEGYKILIDDRNVRYKDNLETFCSSIRECNYAITLISDAYLKSVWCMREVLELMKDIQFDKKVLPIIIDNTPIFTEEERATYVEYWQNKFNKLKKKADNLEHSHSIPLSTTLKLLGYISYEISSFTSLVGGRILTRKLSDCKKNNFKEITDAIGPPPEKLIKILEDTIRTQITKTLDKKLHDKEFIQMELECGTVEEIDNKFEEDSKGQISHGRNWTSISYNKLFSVDDKFILASSVGMGKTTFIYYLSHSLLEKGRLPLVSSCRDFEIINPANSQELFDHYSILYAEQSQGKLKPEEIREIIETRKNDIIFLFDGLDQIQNENDSDVAMRISEICVNYPFLIASRPSSVGYFETKEEYLFLRLKFFSSEALSAYFGTCLERAKKLTRFAPEIIRIPMLAYMVLCLIRKGDIPSHDHFSRTDLYAEFIRYIFKEHEPNRANYSPTLARNIEKSLHRISYEALDAKEPQIQKISLDFCFNVLNAVTCEKLVTFGFINLIIEKNDFLFFSHQSFQEYFAACYVRDTEGLIEHVIAESWNPKWQEVIKFLVGFKGNDILKRLYYGSDNVIHSKLFFSCECVPDTNDPEPEYIQILQDELHRIQFSDVLSHDLIKAAIYLNDCNYVIKLLNDEDARLVALPAIGQITGHIPKKIIDGMIELLNDPSKDICENVLKILGRINEPLPDRLIPLLFELLTEEDNIIFIRAARLFSKVNEIIPQKSVSRLVELLIYKNGVLKSDAQYALIENVQSISSEEIECLIRALTIKDSNDWGISKVLSSCLNIMEYSHFVSIIELLKENDRDILLNAERVLCEFKERLPDKIMKEIVKLLAYEEKATRFAASSVLRDYREYLAPEIVLLVCELLYNDNSYVRSSAAMAISEIKTDININKGWFDPYERGWWKHRKLNKNICIPNDVIDRLGELLNDEDADVRRDAIGAIGTIKEKIPEKIINKIIELLNDKNGFVCSYAMSALIRIKSKIPQDLVINFSKLLNHENTRVRCSIVSTFSQFNEALPLEIIIRIGELLDDEERMTRLEAANTLGEIKENIPSSFVSKIIVMLTEVTNEIDFLCRPRSALCKMCEILNNEHMLKIVELLSNSNSSIRWDVRWIIKENKNNVTPEIFSKIGNLINDKNKEIKEEIAFLIGELFSYIPSNIFLKLKDSLKDVQDWFCKGIIECTQFQSKEKISVEIIDQLVDFLLKIEGEIGDYRTDPSEILFSNRDKISPEIVERISRHKLNYYSYALLKALYSTGLSLAAITNN